MCSQQLWIADACCATCDSETSSSRELSKHEHTVCQSAGRLFVDGETWQLAPCTSCTCRVGNVLCRVVECPPIACIAPKYRQQVWVMWFARTVIMLYMLPGPAGRQTNAPLASTFLFLL
ncbi:unnamed protein product [Gongylonema pulchrum]|uniref:VWFC domain-containing protein n=1 Tax=Gongylonema pulchrum TaxID=637853 RepID=A0A3P7NE03_9BILA|nr:unnamed protein product [Gongylonema pulchrum]